MCKIHKVGTPLRPIVVSRGTVNYGTTKDLARILNPLVGKSSHHVLNTRDFVQHIKGIKLQQDECIILYDVKALFTSVPIGPTINTIKDKLTKDKDLQQRTSMAVHHIISLLEFCLKNTYFVVQGRYYEQLEGAVMGSPISPIVAIYIWKNLKLNLSVYHHIPQVCGKDMWITHLWSSNKHMKNC